MRIGPTDHPPLGLLASSRFAGQTLHDRLRGGHAGTDAPPAYQVQPAEPYLYLSPTRRSLLRSSGLGLHVGYVGTIGRIGDSWAGCRGRFHAAPTRPLLQGLAL